MHYRKWNEHMMRQELPKADIASLATCIQNAYHLTSAWINNYIHHKLWDEITYLFPNFKWCNRLNLVMDE